MAKNRQQAVMNEVAREWLAARRILADALGEIVPASSRPVCERNAEAILARLANHRPPILAEFHKDGSER